MVVSEKEKKSIFRSKYERKIQKNGSAAEKKNFECVYLYLCGCFYFYSKVG